MKTKIGNFLGNNGEGEYLNQSVDVMENEIEEFEEHVFGNSSKPSIEDFLESCNKCVKKIDSHKYISSLESIPGLVKEHGLYFVDCLSDAQRKNFNSRYTVRYDTDDKYGAYVEISSHKAKVDYSYDHEKKINVIVSEPVNTKRFYANKKKA